MFGLFHYLSMAIILWRELWKKAHGVADEQPGAPSLLKTPPGWSL
jgi:hypothetical protein